jgi:hypothetical protein
MKFITIGSDPEFFVLDPAGKPYPATNFAIGTKDNPSPIVNGFFEQRDNLSFEGNIPPAKTKEEFITSMLFLRNYFQSKVEKFGYSLSPNGVEYFQRRFLTLPEANEFGCSSVISSWDSNILGRCERLTPVLGHLKFRVSGFHIHIGYEEDINNKCISDILIGRLFDLFLTIPSHNIKPEPERIQTYGQYGMIRSKSYGVECRTLSTFFTQEVHLGWVWDQVMKIEQFINESSRKDLGCLVEYKEFVNPTNIKKVFIRIFDKFSNKTVLSKFNEITDLYDKDELTFQNNIVTATDISVSKVA